MLSFLTEVLICRVAEKRKILPHCEKRWICLFAASLLYFLCSNDKLYIYTAKVAEKRFILAYFCRYSKKRKNIAQLRSLLWYTKYLEAHLQPSQYHPPPGSRLKQRPYPHEKFFIFFYGKRGGGEYRKKLNFFFLYIFLFIIYII